MQSTPTKECFCYLFNYCISRGYVQQSLSPGDPDSYRDGEAALYHLNSILLFLLSKSAIR